MTQPSSIESPQPAGHRTAFSAVGISAEEELVKLNNHRWRAAADVSLSLDDLGSLQGATLVERLRTINGQPLDVDEHLDRLQTAARQLSITWPRYLNRDLIEECVSRNRHAHAAPDFGVVILLTPGSIRSKPLGSQPTVIVHSTDLHWSQLADWYQHGQPLVIANNRNVPDQCWSVHMKTRSRMHYYLADQQAQASELQHAGAIMLSMEGHVSESSVANILVIDGEQLVSPPIESVLHGLSLRRTLRLAQQAGIGVRFENISLVDAQRASGLLLTGSSGCLWPASQLGDARFADPTTNGIYSALQTAWNTDLGLDYAAQAIELSSKARS